MSLALEIDPLVDAVLRASAYFAIPADAPDYFRQLIALRVRDFAPDIAAELRQLSAEDFAHVARTAASLQHSEGVH